MKMTLLILSLVLLIGCSNSNENESAPTPTPSPANESMPATEKATEQEPTPSPEASQKPSTENGEKLITEAAGIGCIRCHGVDLTGSDIGPSIVGKTKEQIKFAIGIADAMSSFDQLSDQQLDDLAAYLQSLKK